jgi:hypothetical protein
MYGAKTGIAPMPDRKFIYSAAFWLIAMAAQLSGFTHPVVAALLAVAGTGVFVWAIIDHARDRRRQGKPIVEAGHVILIGLIGGVISLALVAIGFAWQTFWPPAPSASAAIITPPQLTKKLSPSDLDERLKAIAVAYNIALKARAFADKYGQQMGDPMLLWPSIKGGGANKYLQQYADDFKPILDQIEDFAKNYRGWLPEVDQAFLGSPYTPQVISLYKAALDLRMEVQNWAERPNGLELIERSVVWDQWKESNSSFRPWIDQAIANLTALRREYERY